MRCRRSHGCAQATTMATRRAGSIADLIRIHARCSQFRLSCVWPQLCDTAARSVGDDLAERPGQRCGPAAFAQLARQQRKHQFGEAVGLFQVRIAGENEGVEPELRVFLDARRDRLRIADQRGAGAAAHQADAGPQVGADLQVGAACASAARHAAPPCAAGPSESIRAKAACARTTVSSSSMADQVVGGLPGSVVGLAHDHMQPDAEAHLAAVARRALAHVGDFLATSAGGSPQVR